MAGVLMTKRRVLVSWIGHSDLKAMAAASPGPIGAEILSELAGAKPAAGDTGPFKTLIELSFM
jgi:hypothetical protein